MKFLAKYGTYLAIALLALAFILTLFTPAVIFHYKTSYGSYTTPYSGQICIFGDSSTNLKATFVGILIFLFAFIDIIAFAAKYLLPLFNIHALDKFSNLINLCGAVLMFLNGILSFSIVGAFVKANDIVSYSQYYAIGAGWVFAALFYIAASACILVPFVMNLLNKSQVKE